MKIDFIMDDQASNKDWPSTLGVYQVKPGYCRGTTTRVVHPNLQHPRIAKGEYCIHCGHREKEILISRRYQMMKAKGVRYGR